MAEANVVEEVAVQTQPEQKPVKKRMAEQDIAKGIAIILVVLMHTLVLEKTVFSIVGLLFGFIMSMFFFLSGFNYKPGKSYKENILKRVKQILIPFLIYTLSIVVIVGAYFLIKGDYTFLQELEAFGYVMLGAKFSPQIGLTNAAMNIYRSIMTSWFILMLFAANFLFYAVVDFALKGIPQLLVVCIGCLGFTMGFGFFNFYLPFYLVEAPTIVVMMVLGAAFRKYKLFEIKKVWLIIASIVGYGLYVGLEILFPGSGFIMGGTLMRTYGPWEALLTVAYSVLGTYGFLNFCKLIAKVRFLTFFFTWFGNNSMYFLMLHQLVNIFLREIFNYHPTARMTTAEETEWISLLIAGLTIVVVILYIIGITFLKKKLKEKKAAKTV